MDLTPVLFHGLDDAQVGILSHLLSHGTETSPRGLTTLESRGISFTIANPRARCIVNPIRKWSLPLALGELCWHLSEETRVDALAYYAPIWKNFADPTGHVRGSCYGAKALAGGPESAWHRARTLLASDPESRRAVIYFNDHASHLELDCRDAACAVSLQFLIRGKKLESIVSMRSNDAVWGLPYDIFLFTFLQELMAVQLGLDVGPYRHFAASVHLYQKHFDLAKRMIAFRGDTEFSMPPMVSPDMIPTFLHFERLIRTGDPAEPVARQYGGKQDATLPLYWAELQDILRRYKRAKSAGWPTVGNSNGTYERILSPLRGLESTASATA